MDFSSKKADGVHHEIVYGWLISSVYANGELVRYRKIYTSNGLQFATYGKEPFTVRFWGDKIVSVSNKIRNEREHDFVSVGRDGVLKRYHGGSNELVEYPAYNETQEKTELDTRFDPLIAEFHAFNKEAADSEFP
jgi:hypothetical protein